MIKRSHFSVREGEQPLEVKLPGVDRVEIEKEITLTSLFLRKLSLCVHHDFDYMRDYLFIISRSAPFSSMTRESSHLEKRVMRAIVPEDGTPEREGFDLALSYLNEFFRDHH